MAGFIQLLLSHPNKIFNLFFFLISLLLFHTTCLQAHLSCPQEQSSALLLFKSQFSFNKSASFYCDSSYSKLESWKEGTNCCSWDGVECDIETSQVVGLDLSCSWLQLKGTIHPKNNTLFHPHLPPHLQRLNLAYNDFHGSRIPYAFTQLTQLTHLNLSSSEFSGQVPIEFSFLNKLVSLDLSWNDDLRLQGIGFELLVQNLTKIRELDLGWVNISTMLPNSLLNLTSLTYLGFSFCGFHGKFLPGIFQLPRLKKLDLSYNWDLTGYFPQFMNSSSSLQYLYLYETRFFGELPDTIGNLKSLEVLDVYYCQLYGSIPMSLGNLTKITLLGLSFNNFTGELPDTIGNLKSLEYLLVSGCQLYGSIPMSLGNLTKITWLDLSYNNFTGELPDTIGNLKSLVTLDVHHCQLYGSILMSLGNLTKITLLDLSSNNFTGILPSSFSNLINLNILDLSDNHFHGKITDNFGILTRNLFVLNLKMNKFFGIIPDTFANGSQLATINFNGNRFEGAIPKSLVNCQRLKVLDLGSNMFFDEFPHWLDSLPYLHVLILQSNKFHGPIPASKTKFPFPKLRVIDISKNDFSGPLPRRYFENFEAFMNVSEVNSQLEYVRMNNSSSNFYTLTMVIKGLTMEMQRVLTYFAAINLSQNKFQGEIPETIGWLNSIRGLNLSHNRLSGHIPASLGNLRNLEWLDLSSNKLTGKIPQNLTNLGFLEVLNLSGNQLTGPIPRGKQFDTFSNDSYIDNLALCGTPLSNACSNTKMSEPPPSIFEDSESSSGFFNWEVIMAGYGCGLVFGISMGYIMFSIGKPQWFVRIIERDEIKSRKRPKKVARRHRDRRN